MINTGYGRSSKHAQALRMSDRNVEHFLRSDLPESSRIQIASSACFKLSGQRDALAILLSVLGNID